MRLTPEQGEKLLLHGDPIELGQQADAARRKLFDDTVTFIVDRNINYTNVCKNECKFCAFFRRKEHKDAYLLTYDEILAKVRETVECGGTQVMIQGGLYPDLGLDYYEKMLRLIKQNFPSITIHSFTATEIQYFAQQAGLSILDTLKRLQEAGLDSLPGGGAEILVDEVRRRVSPKKIMTDDWLHVMECAHSIGMESTATMVIGFGETMAQRIEHMEKIRRLQDKTGGFRAFITWTFQPGNTELGGEKTSGWDYMKTLSMTRLYMDNIKHIQGSWVTQGERIGQLTLGFGADDLGSIMLEENVVRAAGTNYEMSINKMADIIRGAGKQPAQRDTEYNVIRRF
ncbi:MULTISPECIES: cyclic dehypoxanthinyl futalosine synthase [Selenomonas]|uniref:Cyclic dehypoxanthine futalosine synthase n=1 Tax=Selenomonas ruminis TaxID=2593411 RepID=A0A5D6VZ65_9FIRM|nr:MULTISPECIES: cyclic dehypoxanthinyl futalosine synthase [unclassified Selenomonas]MBQ1866744.1 dehypoxanthine futalosine cyclase [Selenomonas sp.]TYZ19838.1 dehypoxanthine futalosine cyclase [Selenomonas sp. mPRGC5]